MLLSFPLQNLSSATPCLYQQCRIRHRSFLFLHRRLVCQRLSADELPYTLHPTARQEDKVQKPLKWKSFREDCLSCRARKIPCVDYRRKEKVKRKHGQKKE